MSNAYPKYKPSGVEWLGDVPEHWKLKRLKSVGRFKAGAGFPDDEQGHEEGELPFFKVADMTNPGNEVFMKTANNYIAKSTARKLGAYVFKSQTVIFAKVGAALLLNRRRIISQDSCIDNNTMGYELRTADFKYIYYWLTPIDFGRLSNPGAVPSINDGQLREIPVALPPLPEQQAIAAFLDRETGRIDALIAKKERLLELLAEQRTALISRAVTKGLDASVKLKPSGVEWLGDVPEHWKALPLKRIVAIPVTDGPHETPEILDEGIPFISAEAIRDNKIDFNRKRGFISASEHRRFCLKYQPNRGDIYMIKSGATTGNLAIVETDEEFSIWSPLAVIRVHNKKADARFILAAMNSKEFQTSVQLFWSFGTQQNIGMNVIENLPIPLPPLPEQQAIAAYLDRETAKIDALSAKVTTVIERLKEYRTALISSAVTGKIDVREAV